MGLGTEQATILVKLMTGVIFVSRRKRERLMLPKQPGTGASTPETGAAS